MYISAFCSNIKPLKWTFAMLYLPSLKYNLYIMMKIYNIDHTIWLILYMRYGPYHMGRMTISSLSFESNGEYKCEIFSRLNRREC